MTTQLAPLVSSGMIDTATMVLVVLGKRPPATVSVEILLRAFPLISISERQIAVINVLGSRPDCTADQLLGLMWQTKNTDVQLALVNVLESRPDCTADQLLGLIKEQHWMIRLAIVNVLESRSDCTTDQLLRLMEQVEDTNVRRMILKALRSRVKDLKRIAGE